MSGANARLTSEPFAVSHRNGRRLRSQRNPARTSDTIDAGGRGGGAGKRIVAATVAATRNDTPSAANANGIPDDIHAGSTDDPPRSAGRPTSIAASGGASSWDSPYDVIIIAF